MAGLALNVSELLDMLERGTEWEFTEEELTETIRSFGLEPKNFNILELTGLAIERYLGK